MPKSGFGKQAQSVDKNFRIHYDKFRTLEDDEKAQIEHIFNHFNFSTGPSKTSKANTKVKTQYLGEILQLLQYNVGQDETKELQVWIDKSDTRFSVEKLISMLGTYSFQEQTPESLLQSFQELDEDANGTIPKAEMRKILTTMGEGLSNEEIEAFFELACTEEDPNNIDIALVTEILLPKMESTNLLAQRNQNASQDEIAANASVDNTIETS